jgi:hypothetical protein
MSIGVWVYSDIEQIIEIYSLSDEAKEDLIADVDFKSITSSWMLLGASKSLKADDFSCKRSDESIIIYKYTDSQWRVFDKSSNTKDFDSIFPCEGFWIRCKK